MPELPEVTTIVRELSRFVRGKTIRSAEADPSELFRSTPASTFRRGVAGLTFGLFQRRAKFILVPLGKGRNVSLKTASWVLLWHMGMTGHPLYRNPKSESRNATLRAAMADPMNRHVRVAFHFTDGTRLDYADIRKFGKLELVRPAKLQRHASLHHLGPDALELANDATAFCATVTAERRHIKVVLMDQRIIAGIGNIYADEILWTARVHPLLPAQRVTGAPCARLRAAVRSVLRQAIRAHGTSIDDYRRVRGGKGSYGAMRKVYQRTGLSCPRCGTLIHKLVVGGRGTHICPRCQRVSFPSVRTAHKNALV
ncbi:MAG: formamidopyrimidine-DNA glycosylase [Parcubacteria group bacterium Gr01-1014_106]|nr:MAG: formamidopyrimidine-DNA glycosylase [Parcubacteria group bacterium Gr01-1014_106]